METIYIYLVSGCILQSRMDSIACNAHFYVVFQHLRDNECVSTPCDCRDVAFSI